MKKIVIVLALLLIPITAGASLDTNLYYGLQNNSDVRELQEFLIDKGFLTGTSATGNFYSLTLKAVKAYQASEGIIQTGYVGTLTRTAINNELTTQLLDSNTEAINETGTTPPAPTPQATTNDVVATLQAQIALLLQQVQAMQSQQTATQQIVQNTQQIVQNTTPSTTCSVNWQCSNWSTCANSQQTRSCWDSSGCGITSGKPSETQSCTSACSPNWQCGSWSACANSSQTRICTDDNNCGVLAGKPSVSQSCITPVLGCTDSTKKNYNPSANTDDGSCVAYVYGCTDIDADNYNSIAEKPDNSCVYSPELYLPDGNSEICPLPNSISKCGNGCYCNNGSFLLKASHGDTIINSENPINFQIVPHISDTTIILPNTLNLLLNGSVVKTISCPNLQCSFNVSDAILKSRNNYTYSIKWDASSLVGKNPEYVWVNLTYRGNSVGQTTMVGTW